MLLWFCPSHSITPSSLSLALSISSLSLSLSLSSLSSHSFACFLSSFFSCQSVYHGFPMSPSAISYDDESQLLAIGTETGELRM